MKTVKITPRGYCHGVVNAINTITKIGDLSTKKPIYILGMVIHNKKVVESFDDLGVITLDDKGKTRLELLDEIDSGTVVFTAHGVSPEVFKKAKEKGLDIIDTTCKDVYKSQDVVVEYLNNGYDIIYIGKKHHPESEAAMGISPKVHFVETIDDVKHLNLSSDKIAVTNQTTMSFSDVFLLAEQAKKIYPQLEFIDEICNATRIRQEAISKQDGIDHCFVVGDKLSNNSQKLAYVSKTTANVDATLIESVEDIDIEVLKTFETVSVSSGASTPTKVTNEVIQFLEKFDKNDPSTHNNVSSITPQNLFKKSTS
jgi:4-hydroxy-3-methylbut-2-enyl diphosphate reductase